MEQDCPLCKSRDSYVKLIKEDLKIYRHCRTCGLTFLNAESFLSPSEEKSHYLTHNNDVTDIRYQKFVSPIIDYIVHHIGPDAKGLDYGAGEGPIVASQLTERNFDMKVFDVHFWSDPSVLEEQYDFITASEVVEHFYKPAEEFQLLKSLLKEKGLLIIMTDPYRDDISFTDWYYHRDPTHVVFYSEITFNWIKQFYGFIKLERVNERVWVFKK